MHNQQLITIHASGRFMLELLESCLASRSIVLPQCLAGSAHELAEPTTARTSTMCKYECVARSTGVTRGAVFVCPGANIAGFNRYLLLQMLQVFRPARFTLQLKPLAGSAPSSSGKTPE
jgi:hypothetical protein